MGTQDTVTVAPSALITIAREATLRVAGVSHMSNTPGGAGRLLRRTPSANGVRIAVDNNAAAIDLYVILKAGTCMREVSGEIQHEVARVMHEIVGLNVASVDVHIVDVDFTSSPEPA